MAPWQQVTVEGVNLVTFILELRKSLGAPKKHSASLPNFTSSHTFAFHSPFWDPYLSYLVYHSFLITTCNVISALSR